MMGYIGSEHVKDEAVRAGQLEVLQAPCLHSSNQDRSGQVWDHHPGEPIDEADDGDDGQAQPPQPQHQEVFLVEKVVREDAEVVGSVNATSSGTNTDIAGDLSGEEFTHGVVGQPLSVLANVLHRPDETKNLATIIPELSKEECVGDDDAEEDHHQVHHLAEAEVDVVAVEPGPEVEVVASHVVRVTVLDDVPDHVALEEVPPHAARELGEPEAEREQERQPEVVRSHRSVLWTLDLRLVDEAAGRLSLEVRPNVGSSVDPAVRSGVLVPALADDGSTVQVVLQEDEQQPEHDHERRGLVMQPEEGVVYGEFVALEPFQQVTDNGQSIYHRRRHIGFNSTFKYYK